MKMDSKTALVTRVLLSEREWMGGYEVSLAVNSIASTYAILTRMDVAGWIETCWLPGSTCESPRRRMYRIRPEYVDVALRSVRQWDKRKRPFDRAVGYVLGARKDKKGKRNG